MNIPIRNYTFDASAGTITFTDYPSVELTGLVLITNMTAGNKIIFNFAAPTKTATVVGNVVHLGVDTAAMSDTDKLQIIYDDGVIAATKNSVDAVKTAVDAVATKMTSDPATATGVGLVKTAVDAVTAKLITAPATEAKQDTGNSTLSSILAKIIAAPATEATLASVLAKLTADPATATGVGAVKTAVDSVTAKLIAAPATEAKQDTGNTTLGSILTALGALATQTTLGSVLTKLNDLATAANQTTGNDTMVGIYNKIPAGLPSLIGQTELNSIMYVMRRLMRMLESNTVVDNRQRQRVTIDGVGNGSGSSIDTNNTVPISGTVTANVNGTVPVSFYGYSVGSTVNYVQGPTAGSPVSPSTYPYQPVWEGPVDQRWRVMDAARTNFAVGTRRNLNFGTPTNISL